MDLGDLTSIHIMSCNYVLLCTISKSLVKLYKPLCAPQKNFFLFPLNPFTLIECLILIQFNNPFSSLDIYYNNHCSSKVVFIRFSLWDYFNNLIIKINNNRNNHHNKYYYITCPTSLLILIRKSALKK